VAFRPIHGFATAISKTFFRQSLKTLTTPIGREFLERIKEKMKYAGYWRRLKFLRSIESGNQLFLVEIFEGKRGKIS